MKKQDLRELNFVEGALLGVNKPEGWSSFDVVRKLRNLTGAKTGHGGTLDPLATGLLLIATGRFTKKLTELQGLPKEYTGTFYVGATTPSFDRETEVDNRYDISHLTLELLKEAAKSLSGRQEQMPPVFSAVKVDGVRSYKLARKGQATELNARTVDIFSFDIEKVEFPLVHFRVHVSKGTYIRALASDFGKALGVGAYLHSLCRTKIGEYRLEDAWELEELIQQLKKVKEEGKHEDLPLAG